MCKSASGFWKGFQSNSDPKPRREKKHRHMQDPSLLSGHIEDVLEMKTGRVSLFDNEIRWQRSERLAV